MIAGNTGLQIMPEDEDILSTVCCKNKYRKGPQYLRESIGSSKSYLIGRCRSRGQYGCCGTCHRPIAAANQMAPDFELSEADRYDLQSR